MPVVVDPLISLDYIHTAAISYRILPSADLANHFPDFGTAAIFVDSLNMPNAKTCPPHTFPYPTLLVHADDHLAPTTDIAPTLHPSTTYLYPTDPEDWHPAADDLEAHRTEPVYSRVSYSSTDRAEQVLGQLLGGYAMTYGSGLSAIHAVFIHVNPKKLCISEEAGYHGTKGVAKIIRRLNNLVRPVLNLIDGQEILPMERLSELNPGDLLWLETPINPFGVHFDIEKLAHQAHSQGAVVGVDATFAPPPLLDPFKWGADFVMHSATKYLGGHSDLLAGVIVAKDRATRDQLFDDRIHIGCRPGTMESWLLLRSLRTLHLRIPQQSSNATKLVAHLASGHSVIRKVVHASLQKEEFVKQQLSGGYPPCFAVYFKTEQQARVFCAKTKIFRHATSLGGAESLCEWRAMSDATVDRTLVRISVGIEGIDDLICDVDQALELAAKG